MHSFHNIVEKKKDDALASEPDVLCGVCSERCNGTIHTCHGVFVHGYCLDEIDHKTCKKCMLKFGGKAIDDTKTPSSSDENGGMSFKWDGHTTSPAKGVDIIGLNASALDGKELATVFDAAASRLMNSNSRSELILICDLIQYHVKDRVIIKLDEKPESHADIVEGLRHSTVFRLGFLPFQREV